MKEFSELTNDQKGALAFRIISGVLLSTITGMTMIVVGYVKSSDEKLTATASDVAQIKWELPIIKHTAEKDRSDVMSRIGILENRLESLQSLGVTRNSEISALRTEIELLKQKLP